MPTIREHMKQQLINKGLFDSQADAVITQAEKNVESMQGTWGRQVDAYPPMIITQMLKHVKATALTWINEHDPNAWFKREFE